MRVIAGERDNRPFISACLRGLPTCSLVLSLPAFAPVPFSVLCKPGVLRIKLKTERHLPSLPRGRKSPTSPTATCHAFLSGRPLAWGLLGQRASLFVLPLLLCVPSPSPPSADFCCPLHSERPPLLGRRFTFSGACAYYFCLVWGPRQGIGLP